MRAESRLKTSHGVLQLLLAALAAGVVYLFLAHRKGPPPCKSSLAAFPKFHQSNGSFVFTTIVGFDSHSIMKVYRFLESWRRFSPQAKVVAFVDKIYDIEEFEVEQVVVKWSTEWHVFGYRFVAYRDYLKAALAKGSIRASDHIVITDCRDVVLQADPFSHKASQAALKAGAVLFSKEGSAIREVSFAKNSRDSGGFNTRWIRECYGERTLRQLAKCDSCSVICAGIFLGHVDTVRQVIELLLARYASDEKLASIHGCDQAILNELIWNKKLGAIKTAIVSNWQSPIFTAQYGTPFSISRVGGNVWPKGSTEKPAIIHQYDRYEELNVLYEAMFPVNSKQKLIPMPSKEKER